VDLGSVSTKVLGYASAVRATKEKHDKRKKKYP